MSRIPSEGSKPKMARLTPRNGALTQDELEKTIMESDEEFSNVNFSEDYGSGSASDSESDEEKEVDKISQFIPSTSRIAPAIQANSSVTWSADPPTNPPNIHFSQLRRLIVTPDDQEPVDFFNLLVDGRFYELITTESNKYANESFLEDKNYVYSRIRRWKPLEVNEFRTFLGLLLHMGTVSMNRIQDYWRKDPLFNCPIFASKMSRDRFLLILRCLHFHENPKSNDPQPQDRLFKIRPLVNYFNQKMENIFYPGKNLTLDECMVLWKGRLVLRQHIRNMKHKYGIKLYMLTEPNGVNLKFAVYTGALDDWGGSGHAATVVLHLMQEKLDIGHSLFMGDYYNSYILARELLSRNTKCTGILRSDRKNNPPEIETSKLKRGENIAFYSEGVMIGKWRDKKQIAYISTEFGCNKCQDHNRRGQMKEKPEAIVMYNKNIGGVDRQDHYYLTTLSQRRPLNGTRSWEFGSNRRMTFYDFRLHVIRDLLKIKETNNSTPKLQTSTNHTPTKLPPTPAGKIGQRRCRLCYNNKKRKETAYFCDACPGKPPLCVVPCFGEYHVGSK